MVKLALSKPNGSPRRILCLGAHSDDIEIGCGGTILRLLEETKNTAVRWVVFSSDKERAAEARQAAKRFLKSARTKDVETNGFTDSFFPSQSKEIKEHFNELRKGFSPDVVFTHFRNDFHQDHRVISELTWNTFRDHLILEYEIPKYDGDLGAPNVFVPLDRSICERKVKYIVSSFPSQRSKQWFSVDTFSAILRLRGVESNSPSRYAEAFYCRKLSI
jgi:LmbE family N-acetylglucosaminyl deacetylase